MIRQMFRTYGLEVDEDRIKGYLTVLQPVPMSSISEAIRSAMGNAKSFPPGPGDILSSWRWSASQTREVDPRGTSNEFRVGPGESKAKIAEVSDQWVPISSSMKRVRDRSKELRREGKYVPKPWTPGNLLGHIKASIELNVEWPLHRDVRKRLSQDMRVFEEEGGDGAWWWEECERPTVTRPERREAYEAMR